jgi:opine dehydrogenase
MLYKTKIYILIKEEIPIMKKFVIIGAGNGGQSLAGDMVLRGATVTAIYDKNAKAVEAIADNGGIKMSGPVAQGFAPITCATGKLEEAMNAGDVFLVAITSNFHRALAAEMAPYVKPEHTIVLLPGYVGSSMSFANTLKKAGVEKLPLIGETVSFPYATRLVEPAHAGIKARKLALPCAAFPASRNEEFIKIVQEAIPEAILASDTLSVGFNNVNPAAHVAYYLFNLGKVESPEARHSDFHSWGTPTVTRMKYDFDNERISIMKAMGLKPMSYDEFNQICYKGEHFHPLPQNYNTMPANASQVPNRFIDEDIPMGLIPMAEFAKLAGVSTPTIDTFIQMANLVRQKDFHDEGSTFASMGCEEMTLEQIMACVRG